MNPTSLSTRGALAAAIAALMLGVGSDALAADAVTLQNWNGGVGAAPAIGVGDTLTATKNLPKSNMADNPDLNYSAWAHAGGSPWYSFQLTTVADLVIRLDPTNPEANFNPGLTLWTSGATPFDGGTSNFDEVASNAWNAPHSFNAFGQIGDPGTFWMSGDLGTQLETLAYASTGPAHDASETGWGETIAPGVHDVSVSDLYEQGIGGSAVGNAILLTVHGAQAGWYTVFIGGTNHALASASYELSVSAVPLPAPFGMLCAALGAVGLGARRRARA